MRPRRARSAAPRSSLALAAAPAALAAVLAACAVDAPSLGDDPAAPGTETEPAGGGAVGGGAPDDAGTPLVGDASGGDAAADAGDDAAFDAGPPAEPLDLAGLAPRTWRYLSIPGTSCRDGSEAGVAVSPSPTSTRVVVYLQGGGACFNQPTCEDNPASVSRRSGGSTGVFDRSNPANPVANDTFVFVPYCTGDVHAGNEPNGVVPGVGPQKFVGYTNTTTFLRRVAATFPATTQVLLTGSSAGGFGASANYMQAAHIFSGVPVTLVNDAGPLMRAPFLAPCLQAQWRTLWKLDATVLAACGADCAGQPDFLLAASRHAAKAYPRAAQGLVTSLEDVTIRQFFGFGANACTAYDGVPGATFARGVADLRAAHADLPNHAVYAFAGTKHTSLGDASYFTASAGRPSIASWVGQMLTGQANDVGAAP